MILGILALDDISVANSNKIVTGGADKNATVFNKEFEQVVARWSNQEGEQGGVPHERRRDHHRFSRHYCQVKMSKLSVV